MSPDEVDARIAASETRIAKAIFPGSANNHETLFSGLAMQLMDEAAFIAATRFARKQLVMVSCTDVTFRHPIGVGTIAEAVARVTRVGRTSLTAHVEVFVERVDGDERRAAVEGTFSLVAVDADGRPIAVDGDST